MMDARTMAMELAKALDNKKGGDIKVLKTADVTTLADYFVLCTGTKTDGIVGEIPSAFGDEADELL